MSDLPLQSKWFLYIPEGGLIIVVGYDKSLRNLLPTSSRCKGGRRRVGYWRLFSQDRYFQKC